MSMAAYDSRLDFTPRRNARQAAVLVLLYPNLAGQISTVFIERQHNKHDHHSGQISFPGGKLDPNDTSLENCATREAEEEVGLKQDAVEVLGRLTPLYIPVSNFIVTPVVAAVESAPVFNIQPEEVRSILPSEISYLATADRIKHKSIPVSSNVTLENVPYFDVLDKTIWGATAMILNEFLSIWKEVNSGDPERQSPI